MIIETFNYLIKSKNIYQNLHFSGNFVYLAIEMKILKGLQTRNVKKVIAIGFLPHHI